MKNLILENINNPENLERLFRENKNDFSRAFSEIPQEYDSELVRFWKIRLTSENEIPERLSSRTDLIIAIIISIATGILVKLPEIFSAINSSSFYKRDLAIIVFNGIIVYTFWQNRFNDKKRLILYGLIILALMVFMNLLPYSEGDSVILAFIHAPLLMWCLLGLAFLSFEFNNTDKRIEFIRFNGELIIMTGLIIIAGGILTVVTIGLFSVINMNIEKFYMEYVCVFGGVAAPVISFYLIRLYPNITSRITPVIARVFTPLVLITLTVYLISFVISDSKIMEDRDLLILFNIMLIAVVAIIVFSISELGKLKKKDFNVLILFTLAILAIVINAIAVSAIFNRVMEGFTPNRTVVLVTNLLIFVNLVILAKSLLQSYFNSDKLFSVERNVAKYLTIYGIWIVVVIFILPLLFNFR